MVSTIKILQTYYHIPLHDQTFFEYQGKSYYLSHQVNNQQLYQQYIQLTGYQPFQPVMNIYHQLVSNQHILYTYEDLELDIDHIIEKSLIAVQKEKIAHIKHSWIKLMDDVKEKVYQSQDLMQNNEYNMILFNYYFGLANLSIELMNHYFPSQNSEIPTGFAHYYCSCFLKDVANPDNLYLSSCISDLVHFYFHHHIQIEDVDYYINKNQPSFEQLAFILCKAIYPSHYFQIIIQQDTKMNQQLIYQYKLLDEELIMIKNIYILLSKYIFIPNIFWLENL